jgi:hypothetical protein
VRVTVLDGGQDLGNVTHWGLEQGYPLS